MQHTRAMAAAKPLPLAGQTAFPPVYPFTTPGPASAVIVGDSLSSPSPQSACKKKKKKTDVARTKEKTKEGQNILVCSTKPLLLHPLHPRLGNPLNFQLALLLDGRGHSSRSLLLAPLRGGGGDLKTSLWDEH